MQLPESQGPFVGRCVVQDFLQVRDPIIHRSRIALTTVRDAIARIHTGLAIIVDSISATVAKKRDRFFLPGGVGIRRPTSSLGRTLVDVAPAFHSAA